jgi:hypothetical protein
VNHQQGKSEQGRIPFRLRIGVTGHRRLDDEEALAGQVRRALERATELLRASPHTQVLFTVVSPLAEGADRLVAREVLRNEGADLEVPLPLPREEYVRDFQSGESKREFEDLLSRAREVVELSPSESREEAYERVGRYVVDRCDVLIALWDGERARGQGGTATIVKYARGSKGQGSKSLLDYVVGFLRWCWTGTIQEATSARVHRRRVPLFWITMKGRHEIVEEMGDGINAVPFRQLDEYNRAKIGSGHFEQQVDVRERELVTAAARSRADPAPVRALSEWVSPHYVRADSLAQRYQTWYYALGNALFLLAAAAVAAAASQVLFAPETPELVWIEVGLMVGLLLIVMLGMLWRFHDRWLSYRFLAERFRSVFFLALSGLGGQRKSGVERVSLGHPSEEWLRRAYLEVWNRRPDATATDSDVDALRRFLGDAWIRDQIKYHEKMSRKYHGRHHRLTRATEALFVATVLAAVLHVFGVAGHASPGSLSWATLLVLLAIALPALGAAISAIRTQREYSRNSERFGRMAQYLEGISARLETAPDMKTVRAIAAEAEDLMLDENRDWFVVMRFHPIELGV